MFAAILLRRLQVMELLVEVRDVRLEFPSLRRQSLFHIPLWTEHEPESSNQQDTVLKPQEL